MYPVTGTLMHMARLVFVLLAAVWLQLAGCGSGSGSGGNAGDNQSTGDSTKSLAAQVDFDVSTATGLDAAQVLRPSVTAYLIDDFDRVGILDTFLADFDQRVGMVLYDALD